MGEEAEQIAVVKVEDSSSFSKEKSSRKSTERDSALAQVENEKKLSFIRAWEEGEKSKADNKAQKKKKAIAVWENSKKAGLEADLKKVEEGYEKKKAEYAEKVRNKIAMVHKTADEKRAMVDAKLGEEVLKAEEAAAKFRATGQTPKKSTFSCFGA
ncbi:remorin-like [Zingiber officinale]|uniref:remorin-like n=1 Tax=Zingiber officinale TaxID=94328 RepID=UPI001C4B10D6|nr:remorin-like [Zingiber officinale]